MVAIGFASFAIVVAVGVALTMFAMAHPLLLELDFITLFSAIGPPFGRLGNSDGRLIEIVLLVFNLPVSIRSLASLNFKVRMMTFR